MDRTIVIEAPLSEGWYITHHDDCPSDWNGPFSDEATALEALPDVQADLAAACEPEVLDELKVSWIEACDVCGGHGAHLGCHISDVDDVHCDECDGWGVQGA